MRSLLKYAPPENKQDKKMSDLINKVEVVNLFRPTSAHISCTKSSRSNHGIS
jgi:hypothetical protein